jgi:hypothetical protein
MSDNRRFGRFASENGSALSEHPEQENSLVAADLEIFGGDMPVRKRQAVMPDNALVKREDGAFVYKQFVLSATAMAIPDGTEEEDWQDIGRVLREMESAVSWWVGDWAVYANRVWGATAKQIAAIFEYEQATIEAYMSVAKSIPGMIRNHTVSFSHHRLVMRLPIEEQDKWITDAAREGWTIAQMREAMKGDTPAPPRWISENAIKDWGFLRSLESRKRTPDEKNLAQIRIDRVRKELDEVERKLWEG